jgi:hypothetical protein
MPARYVLLALAIGLVAAANDEPLVYAFRPSQEYTQHTDMNFAHRAAIAADNAQRGATHAATQQRLRAEKAARDALVVPRDRRGDAADDALEASAEETKKDQLLMAHMRMNRQRIVAERAAQHAARVQTHVEHVKEHLRRQSVVLGSGDGTGGVVWAAHAILVLFPIFMWVVYRVKRTAALARETLGALATQRMDGGKRK